MEDEQGKRLRLMAWCAMHPPKEGTVWMAVAAMVVLILLLLMLG